MLDNMLFYAILIARAWASQETTGLDDIISREQRATKCQLSGVICPARYDAVELFAHSPPITNDGQRDTQHTRSGCFLFYWVAQ